LSLAARTLAISRFAVSALGLDATGNAALGADRVLTAAVQIPAFQPSGSLVALIEPRLPDGVDVGAIESADLIANLEFATAGGALNVPAFTLHLDNATLAGVVAIDELDAPNRITGQLSANDLDNRLLDALFGTWLPDELVATDLGQFQLKTDFTYSSQSGIAEFAPLQLMAYGLSGEGQLTVVNANNRLSLSGRAALAEFSPRALLQRFELPVPQTADPAVFRSAELATSFETNGARGEFRDIAVELDESRITGEFNVDDFANPSYRFVLRADRIDADRYLPPQGETAASADSTSDKRLGDMRLASEPLTNTNVSGTASIGHLTIGGMDFDQLAADLSFGGGRGSLSSVRTQLYGGDFDGGLAIDATGEVSEVRLTGDMSGVNIRPLLEAMLGSAHLSGTGDLQLDLTGRGNTINEALQTAAGRMSLEFTNGVIDGVNLGRKLCEAVNSARGLPAPAAAAAATRYTVIRGNATVSEGNASSSDLYASTGFLDLTGRGGVRLVDQWIDNQHRAEMTGPVPIAGCEDLNRTIANNPIPVNFTLKGQLPDLDVGVDISQLLQDWARREVRQRAEDEVRGAILDRLLN
jgi:AsmA protein